VGSVSVALAGEEVCGDGWEMWQSPDRFVLMLADGLGHGLQAYEAAEEARRVFNLRPPVTPGQLIDNIHRALQKTRGGAVAVADLNLNTAKVTYCGMGNIAGVISADQQRSMVSMNGTVGAGAVRTKEFDYPWPADAVLIMHSDGLHSHWGLESYPGLRSRHAAVIAGILYRDGTRTRDDATVVVVKRT
jgi:serine phosphatase RsbU (regulator of sigma subunit)